MKYSIGKGAVASEILYSLGRQVLGEKSDKIDHFRLKTPVAELLFTGELRHRADSSFIGSFPAESLSARAWIELEPGGPESVFNSELISVGLESATLAAAIDLPYPRDQKFSPRLQKGQAGLRLSIEMDQDDPGSARIKESRLVLSDLAAGGIELPRNMGSSPRRLKNEGHLRLSSKGTCSIRKS